MSPAEVVEQVRLSGLRGRGGAGFPAGIKWKTVHDAQRRPQICGLQRRRGRQRHFRRPHDFRRRPLHADRGHGHRRLCRRRDQGLYLSALGISPRREGHATAPSASPKRAGWIGPDAFGPGKTLRSRTAASAPAPISAARRPRCSTAWKASAALVRAKPPLPALSGLFGKPTLINNVLTLAAIPYILAEGGESLCRLRHGPLARHAADPARRQYFARRPDRTAPSASACARSSRISAAEPPADGRSARCRSAARSAHI